MNRNLTICGLIAALALFVTACGDSFGSDDPNSKRDANLTVGVTNTAFKVVCSDFLGDNTEAESNNTKTGDVFTAEFTGLLVGPCDCTISPVEAEKFESREFSITLKSGDNNPPTDFTLVPIGGGDYPDPDNHLDELATSGNTAASNLTASTTNLVTTTGDFDAKTVTEEELRAAMADVRTNRQFAVDERSAINAALLKAEVTEEGYDDAVDALVALETAIAAADLALENAEQAIERRHEEEANQPDPGILYVRVLEPGAVPAEGAMVQVGTNPDNIETHFTDANGECAPFLLEPGKIHSVVISLDGYQTRNREVTIEEGKEKSIVEPLSPTGAVEGNIVPQDDVFTTAGSVIEFRTFVRDADLNWFEIPQVDLIYLADGEVMADNLLTVPAVGECVTIDVVWAGGNADPANPDDSFDVCGI